MNSSRYCFDTDAVPDFTALCGKFASNEFQSPYRSTVPLLSLVEHLIYLHFHPSPRKDSATTSQYKSDLGDLHSLLGSPANLKFAIVEMPLEATPAFDLIKDLDKRSRATSVNVAKALGQGPLFNFGKPTTTPIGAAPEL